MSHAIWRLVALSPPPWTTVCASCGAARAHESRGRFRVNSNGGRHDVWLLYACPFCDATRKRRLERHIRDPLQLAPYRDDDPELAWRHAFEIRAQRALPARVVRPQLVAGEALTAAIDQPDFCAWRWDRLLAHALGCPRAAVARAWRRGDVRVPGSGARDFVRNGQTVFVEGGALPGAAPRLHPRR